MNVALGDRRKEILNGSESIFTARQNTLLQSAWSMAMSAMTLAMTGLINYFI